MKIRKFSSAIALLGLLFAINANAAKVGDDTLIVSKPGSSSNKSVQLGSSSQGVLRYNVSLSRLESANDGTTFSALGGFGGRSVLTQAGTSYTFALSDAWGYGGNTPLTQFTSSSAVTATIPPNSSVAFGVGSQIDLTQAGTGAITVAPGSGVTLVTPPGTSGVLTGKGVLASLVKTATNTWSMFGSTKALTVATGGNVYNFTTSTANATAGAVYTNNSKNFVIMQTISGATALVTAGDGAPLSSGTLTKIYGTGDATITFSANANTDHFMNGANEVHPFMSSGTFTVTSLGTTPQISGFVLAGGGAGGNKRGGAGGAGGYVPFSSLTVTATGYAVTIGAGGSGNTSDGSPGGNGSNSSLAGLGITTAVGGGGGGSDTSGGGPNNGVSGGSGGGGSSGPGSGAAGTAGQGFAGANSDGIDTGGGGGGAGAAATTTSGGIGASVSYTGNAFYVGGGGGGGGTGGSAAGIGGAGGGGTGSETTRASDGAPGLGAGGGGSSVGIGSYTGGNGGHGMILISFVP